MKLLLAVVVLGSVLHGGLTHTWQMGGCKDTSLSPDTSDFQTLVGKYYVVRKLESSSECLVVEISSVDENTLRIEESRLLVPAQAFNIDTEIKRGGTITRNGDTLLLEWDSPGGFWGSIGTTVMTFKIVVTEDGEKVVVEIHCQNVWGLFSRSSSAIFSTNQNVPPEVMDQAMEDLSNNNIDVDKMDEIDNGSCPDHFAYSIGYDNEDGVHFDGK